MTTKLKLCQFKRQDDTVIYSVEVAGLRGSLLATGRTPLEALANCRKDIDEEIKRLVCEQPAKTAA